MIDSRKPLLLLFSLTVALLLVACTAEPVSVAPSAMPSPEPSTATSTTVHIPTTSSEVPRISVRDLKARLDDGEAILVVDARAAAAFETRHIAGAISVPLSEIESRLDEFPRDQEIVFY